MAVIKIEPYMSLNGFFLIFFFLNFLSVVILCLVVTVFQYSVVAKLILLFSLYGIGPLLPHLAHHPLVISAAPVINLVKAVVDGAECPTPPNTSTAVNQNGVWLRRLGGTRNRSCSSLGLGLGLRLTDGKDEVEDAGTTGGYPIVRPCQELEVSHCSLLTLYVSKTDKFT